MCSGTSFHSLKEQVSAHSAPRNSPCVTHFCNSTLSLLPFFRYWNSDSGFLESHLPPTYHAPRPATSYTSASSNTLQRGPQQASVLSSSPAKPSIFRCVHSFDCRSISVRVDIVAMPCFLRLTGVLHTLGTGNAVGFARVRFLRPRPSMRNHT